MEGIPEESGNELEPIRQPNALDFGAPGEKGDRAVLEILPDSREPAARRRRFRPAAPPAVAAPGGPIAGRGNVRGRARGESAHDHIAGGVTDRLAPGALGHRDQTLSGGD